jgi:preprotein translocase subunit SecD
MDRSLRWRTIALVFISLFCLATLAPSFVDKDSLPSWFTHFFKKEINLGLDLQGGKHIVYNIALDKAIDDKASDIKRDLESDTTLNLAVKTPPTPTGAFTVIPSDPKKVEEIKAKITSDYKGDVDTRECAPDDAKGSLCYVVAASYADKLRKDALSNAVSTIRERINEKGVAEPSVVEKGEDIIVELPGDPNSDAIKDTEELIRRTAKLEMKVVDDCTKPGQLGCTAKDTPHDGAPYMLALVRAINPDDSRHEFESRDPKAKALGIKIIPEQWTPEDGGGRHNDWTVTATDRELLVPKAWAKKHTKITDKTKVEGDFVGVTVTGREVIETYINGDKDLPADFPDHAQPPPFKGLVDQDAKFKVPDDHEIGYEPREPDADAKDQHVKWNTYYLERAVRITGTAIQSAMPSYDQNTNRPVVQMEYNRFGSRVFGDVTTQIAGMKFATLLDGKVKSAPIINGPITGGHAQITMGGGDVTKQEKERDDLVAVLKTGSLPAPLVEASEQTVGPTLGRDAIEKTQTSFIIGIVLVVLIMVGVYRWSGMIAVFAVVFHIIMTLAVMAIFGATLTLPGIAAIVLSIGMEVDGNILIYERIRDELLLGKSVRGAIDLGFSRAFSAILDGQLTTAAAGWVLLQYGSGPIKGFAVMLLVGVFTTLTTNIWVTRILFDHAVARKKGAHMHTFSI